MNEKIIKYLDDKLDQLHETLPHYLSGELTFSYIMDEVALCSGAISLVATCELLPPGATIKYTEELSRILEQIQEVK